MMQEAKYIPKYVDLEITIRKRDDKYYAEMRLDPHDQGGAIELAFGIELQFDLDQLRESSTDTDIYGKTLTRNLFTPPLSESWKRARDILNSISKSANEPLGIRLRLRIDRPNDQLHGLYWETLLDPMKLTQVYENITYLARQRRVLFSRSIQPNSIDYLDIKQFEDTKVLCAISSPDGSTPSKFEVIPAEDIFSTLEVSFRGAQVKRLGPSLTFNELTEYLDKEAYDVVFLGCHGSFVAERGGYLHFYERNEAKSNDGTRRIATNELVDAIDNIIKKPILVILTLCNSAGNGYDDAYRSIGHQLAYDGVGAVIAMQGPVAFSVATKFLPVLIKDLRVHGQVDRAMSSARYRFRDAPEWWRPVLFTRLRHGQVWLPSSKKSLSSDDMERMLPEDLARICEDKSFDAATRLAVAEKLAAKGSKYQSGDPRILKPNEEPVWCPWFNSKSYIFIMPEEETPEEETPEQEPKHIKLFLHKFAISRYPITVRQYRPFLTCYDHSKEGNRRYWSEYGWYWLKDMRFSQPDGWEGGTLKDPEYWTDNFPVVGISWYEATAFCRWLTEQGHKYGWLTNNQVVRLPNEPEWEVAARWGHNGWKDWPTHFIDDMAASATHEQLVNALGAPQVGCFPLGKSPCGALDMAGGVWEWCSPPFYSNLSSNEAVSSVYNPNSNIEETDHFSPDDEVVIRGGSFREDIKIGWKARAAKYPFERRDDLGFRVVLSELAADGGQ